MTGKRKRGAKQDGPADPLAPYRRLRRSMPPPERIEEDRRRELEEQEARRQVEEALGQGEGDVEGGSP
jgi:hypothetical protein